MMMLKGGQRKIISISTDYVAEEKHVSLIEFNRRGEVVMQQNYDH